MGSGRNNLQHRGAGGGGGPGRGSGGGGHRYFQNQSVRGSRKWCDAPQRYSPRQPPNRDSRPPVQGNQPPPPRASGYRRASTAPSVQPQPGMYLFTSLQLFLRILFVIYSNSLCLEG